MTKGTTMVRTHWIAAVAALTMAGLPAGSGAVSPAQEPEAAPGQGVICMAMVISVIAETGRRCHPESLPELQAELRESAAKLDAYILANADISPEQYASDKAQQTGADLSDEEFCASDNELGAIFTDPEGAQALSPSMVRAEVDAAIARSGTPTWGTCL